MLVSSIYICLKVHSAICLQETDVTAEYEGSKNASAKLSPMSSTYATVSVQG
jgi:hypothetical protein